MPKPMEPSKARASLAARCGAKIPNWLAERFAGLDDDAETRRLIAANVAIEQVSRLRHHGVDEFHFYTLNQAGPSRALWQSIRAN